MSKSEAIRSGASMRKSAKKSAAKPGLGRNAKIILSAGALILVIGGLIITARPALVADTPKAVVMVKPEAGNSVSRLTAAQRNFNFGQISMAAGKVTHRYPIRNSGSEPISIRKLYTSCMCTTAALVKNGKASEAFGMPGHAPIPSIDIPIAPQDNVYVEVIFDPAAHGPSGVGPIERVVTIENSAGEPLELAFAAYVSP